MTRSKKTESIVLELTVWERIVLYGSLTQISGLTIGEIDLGLDVLEILELSEEERAQIGYNEPAPGRLIWSDPNQEDAQVNGLEDWSPFTYSLKFTKKELAMLEKLFSKISLPLDKRSRGLKNKIITEA